MTKRRRVLIDCDGVLGGFTRQLLKRLRQANKRLPKKSRFTVPKESEITCWDFIKDILCPKARKSANKILRQGKFWDSLKPIKGAKAAVKQLKDAGIDVVVVTSSWRDCKTWAYYRRSWLERNFGIPKSDIIVCSRKEICGGDAFIDDSSTNCKDWELEHPDGICLLYAAPYNRGSWAWGKETVSELITALT